MESNSEKISVDSIIIHQSEKYLMVKLVVWAFILLLLLSTIGLLFGKLNSIVGQQVFVFLTSPAFLLAAGVVIYTLMSLLIIWIWRSTFYEIKANAIIVHKGMFNKRKIEIDLRLYGASYMERGLFARALGFGSIVLEHRLGPNTDSSIALFNVDDPERHFETLSGILQGLKLSE